MEHDRMMAEMGMTMDMPWRARLRLTFAMWAVMMVGMMTPSAAPVVLLFAAMRRGRGAPRMPGVVFASSRGTSVGSSSASLRRWRNGRCTERRCCRRCDHVQRRGSARLLIAAGVYQLTPFKGACLTHCRSPLGFLMSHWREGAGALRMGIAHGPYCLGCCWVLMCVLFVGGVMNLLWIAALAIFVLVEKVAPGERRRTSGGRRDDRGRRLPASGFLRNRRSRSSLVRSNSAAIVPFLLPSLARW